MKHLENLDFTEFKAVLKIGLIFRRVSENYLYENNIK
jgi:hypothetical protein